MSQRIGWLLLICAAGGGWGCASRTSQAPVDGQALFSAMQQTMAKAGRKVEASLALVTVERSEAAPRQILGGITISGMETGGSPPITGLNLTTNGHLLVPGVFKPDQDVRITALVGENEYVARAIKADETLGMSILKLDADDYFTPLDLTPGADLALGEWAVVLKPTDEDSDYKKLLLPAVCQGEKAGRHRRFLLSQSLTAMPGALVVNLGGQLVGVVEKGSVLAINDLREDIQRLLADATGQASPDDDKQKKGWLGAVFEPVNKDYAKARNIPTSALLVLRALRHGPAAAAGLRDGDLIVALNGKPLRLTGGRLLEYFTKSLNARTGEKFALTVLRDGQKVELNGEFATMPEPEILRAEDLGVTVSSISDSEVFLQNLATDAGVLVTDVHRGSPAANSGTLRRTLISRRDIIVELAGQPTPTIAAFSQALETVRREQPPVVLVKYYRGLMTGYAGLNLALGEKDTGNKQ